MKNWTWKLINREDNIVFWRIVLKQTKINNKYNFKEERSIKKVDNK
jgi:hypothetical protein